MKLLTASVAALALLLGGCAASLIDPADRDTTGAYDGVWIGTVGGPQASTVILPSNWRAICEWEPYEIYLTVDDGMIQLGRLEGKTPVSTKGKFRIDVASGDAGMRQGVMSGNAKYINKFSGQLGGSNPTGRYAGFNPAIGTETCSAKIQFRRQGGSAA